MLAVGGCQFGGRMEWKYWREYGGPRFLFAIRLGATSYSSIRFCAPDLTLERCLPFWESLYCPPMNDCCESCQVMPS